MRILALLLILSSNSLISQEIKKIDSDKSKINYSGSHFLHKWSSQNNNVSGLIQVNNDSITNIGVVAKVEDFKSGNSSLDSNSYRVLEALKYPNIIFKSLNIEEVDGMLNIEGLIEFHGIEKSIKISADLAQTSNSNRLDGEFNINLSDFSIERPSLLLKKIDDQIKISFTLVFN
jgi:polyisoprenoid-binding protein YceI